MRVLLLCLFLAGCSTYDPTYLGVKKVLINDVAKSEGR